MKRPNQQSLGRTSQQRKNRRSGTVKREMTAVSSLQHAFIIKRRQEKKSADSSWIFPERASRSNRLLLPEPAASGTGCKPPHPPPHPTSSTLISQGRRRTLQTLSGRRCLHSFNMCSQTTQAFPSLIPSQKANSDKQEVVS